MSIVRRVRPRLGRVVDAVTSARRERCVALARRWHRSHLAADCRLPDAAIPGWEVPRGTALLLVQHATASESEVRSSSAGLTQLTIKHSEYGHQEVVLAASCSEIKLTFFIK